MNPSLAKDTLAMIIVPSGLFSIFIHNSLKIFYFKEVRKWIAEHKFHSGIEAILTNFDGELLEQLHNISKTAPEFFFTTLKQNGEVDLFSIVMFSNELKKIF